MKATGYNKKNIEIVTNIWKKSHGDSLKCPECGGDMVLIQVEPMTDSAEDYTPYDTIIECNYCDFKIRTQSFTILGSVKSYDHDSIEIASWSPSGSRVVSNFEHILDYDLLKKLEETGELVEFLVVDDRVVQVIG